MQKIRFVPVFLVMAIALIAAARDTTSLQAATPPLVVGVDAGVTLDAVESRLEARGFTIARRVDDLHALQVAPHAGEVADAIERIEEVAGVRYAEPLARVAAADQPNDALYSRQSSYLALINAPAAWDIEKGQPGVIVAVIDTGVNIAHPDLQGNIWINAAEIANNGADDDGNGCVDDLNGCAFVSDSLPGCKNITNGFIQDDLGHGTFVSGIIAAAANGTGIVGVARGVRIMPVKVLDCYGSGDSVATARGIVYAAKMGARVINLSLGGYADTVIVRDAVTQATRDYGALVVASAGNGGTLGVAFPARISEVIAVGATAPNGTARASFSSYGPEVDVVAVGEDVVGPVPLSACNKIIACLSGQAYGSSDGTSFSAPQASGLAALLLSAKSGLSPQQLTDIIKITATPLSAGAAPGWAGAGRINMQKALQVAKSNMPPGDPCVIESVIDGESFTCTGGKRVRMLQIDAPDAGQCGGQWAFDALRYIFLTPGRAVSLQYDVTRAEADGDTLAAPVWRGNDGGDYNLSIVMVYVGLARAADIGAGNVALHDWAVGSQNWAAAAQWNMWAPGKTFNGGC